MDDIQLLAFRLDEQEYALDISHVVQVVRMAALTRPPAAPDYVAGLINLRGTVIPVIDTRRRCGLPVKAYDLDTQLLIARADQRLLGLIVDTVSEVLTLPADNVIRPDAIIPELAHFSAVVKIDHRLLLVLDPATFLADAALDREAVEQ